MCVTHYVEMTGFECSSEVEGVENNMYVWVCPRSVESKMGECTLGEGKELPHYSRLKNQCIFLPWNHFER